MSQRRKLILAVLLVFTVALAALSVYITTRQQAPDDSSAFTGARITNCAGLGTSCSRENFGGRTTNNGGQLDPAKVRCGPDSCTAQDGEVVHFYECGDGPRTNCEDGQQTGSNFSFVPGVCGRTQQIDVFRGSELIDYVVYYTGECTTPPKPAVCPSNLASLTPAIRITLKTETGNSERVVYYKGGEVPAEIPINEVDKTRNLQMFVCEDCDEAELTGPFSELTAEDFYKGRFRVRVIDQNGKFTHDQIYENRSSQVGLTWDSAALKNLKAGSTVRVQILKDNNDDNCKGANIRFTDRVGQISCGGDCFRTDPNVAKGNCATGYTCSNSGSNAGKCILDACAANPALCTDDPTQCSIDEVEPEPLVCGDSCTTGDDCGTGNQCSAGKCVKNTCAENPALCETNMCDLKTNLTCGSQCSTDAQCGSGLQCSAGSCKLITCINNPAACSDTNGCNLVPLPTCGDATCNSNELCERTSVNGTTYRACLEGDEGDAPSGEVVPNCTFTGANACQQVPPEPEVPSCGETCGTNGLCPNNHTCNSDNVCVLNTCLTEGACSDNTCTPTTPTTPICGGACANDTQCPTNHSCNNGKCVLNGCTASTCTNGCTVIPETGILDDARFLLVGMALVTLGYLTYKYRIGRSLSLGLIDSEALFVEKLEQSVEKKMKRRNK